MPQVLWVYHNIIKVDFRNGQFHRYKVGPDKSPYTSRAAKFYDALCRLSYKEVRDFLGTPPRIERAGISENDPLPIKALISLLAHRGESSEELSVRRIKAYNLMNLLLKANANPSPLRDVVLPDPSTLVEFLLLQGVKKRAGISQQASPSF